MTALDLIDRDGLDALTMRRLADELSSAVASLYRHVGGRNEILVLVIDHVIGEVEFPADHLDARRRVEHLAHELRRVLLAHPHLLAGLSASPLVGPNARRGTEHALAGLLDAGHPPQVAVAAYLALVDYVLGSVSFDVGARRAPRSPGAPHWSSSSSAGALDAPSADEVFALGLHAFLNGLDGLDALDGLDGGGRDARPST